ncbi:hypothetical protein Q5Y75_00405 [Ruegeria sp. 2205SS24-7]|uniref:hypothetical protein n=1 Tax=Ruegeria discodermiae TaxID=3064389 RepID=UPI0027413246|nr:hypothetical protein [Ruegeria sp. 2205SS24-7]MDP5215669.1 hypothetical protein [Ruegeria sp. 2205SS24-7]
MRIKVHPDPQHPSGGYAFLELPGDSMPDRVAMAVQDSYSGRWLHPDARAGDEPNWQAQMQKLGPFDIFRHEGADWLRLGPEVVNRLEEYTALHFQIDGKSYEAIWPDTIAPRVEKAVPGALRVTARAQPIVEPVEVKLPPEPVEQEVEIVEPEPERAPPKRRGHALWLAAVLLLCAAGAAAWYMLSDETASTGPESLTPVAETSGSPCALPALQALGGFDAQIAAVRDCGSDVSPDAALTLIEAAAKQGNPQALTLFGTLYDGDELAPRIENLTGLTFADDPAQAAEYYAGAVAAGSDEAQARLDATCARLDGSSLTLEKGAFDDFCR